MRFSPSLRLVLAACAAAQFLAGTPARAGNDIELATFEEPVAFEPQPSAAPAAIPPAPRTAATAVHFVSRSALSATKLPWRPAIQPRGPRPLQRPSKPFANILHEPTISPYLNLERDEDQSQDVPTYFTSVRPRFEQVETTRQQQRELQQLRGQLQMMSGPAAAAAGRPSRVPGAGASARFMDTAQFYGGM